MTSIQTTNCRAESRSMPSQWEMSLLCNDVSRWLGANLESALNCILPSGLTFHQSRPSNVSHNKTMISVHQQLVITSSMERFPNVSQFSHLTACVCYGMPHVLYHCYIVWSDECSLWFVWVKHGTRYIPGYEIFQQHLVLRSVICWASCPRPRGLYYWSTMILLQGF